jgi:rhodanese-related sulfurtransferase
MNFKMISPKELDDYVGQNNAIVIDLRTPDEYVKKHIRGALNIPYERLQGCCMFPMEAQLIFYCDRGAMSMAAAREYAQKGYQTKTVVGGFLAYRGSGVESFR